METRNIVKERECVERKDELESQFDNAGVTGSFIK